MKLTYLEQHLPKVASDFLKTVPHKIITFEGEMGVGKTTFIKQLCKELGVLGNTNSPTFSLVNEYETPNNQRVYHFDFYRLKTETEALDMGIDDYLDSGNYCFIEWPDKIPNLLNIPHTKIKIKTLADNSRQLTVL